MDINIKVELILEVGKFIGNEIDVHSVYDIDNRQDVNSVLNELLYDDFSDYAELKIILNDDDTTVSTYKKKKFKCHKHIKYRWILD